MNPFLLFGRPVVGSDLPPVPPQGEQFNTFDPLDKEVNAVLSSGNLVHTRAGGSPFWAMARSLFSKATGKRYFEFQHTVNGTGGGGDLACGLVIETDPVNTFPGSSTTNAQGAGFVPTWPVNARRYRSGTGVDLTGYGRISSVGGWAGIAVDFDAGKMWFRINGSGWVGGGDPAAGSLPTYTFTPNTRFYPAMSCYVTPQAGTINFGQSAFNATPPTGFTDGWSLPGAPWVPELVSQFTASGTTDAQGVATDGTHIWFSNSTTIFKYTKAGSLVTSRVVSGDAPVTKSQINGMFVKDGVLYVSAAENSTPRKSWIVQYNPDTLAYIAHNQITGDWFSEGLSWKDGYWWMTFHATKVAAKIDPATWAVTTTYPLTFKITGSSGGYGSGTGYESAVWVGDYFLCNVHEVYQQGTLDVYFWNGTGFDEIGRLPRLTPQASQGLAADPVESGIIWYAERNYSGTDRVAKARIS